MTKIGLGFGGLIVKLGKISLVLFLAVIPFFRPIELLANDETDSFRLARDFTVKIRSSVSVPFSGDEAGTFNGAGFVVDQTLGWVATNAHVVSRSKSNIQVSTKKSEFQGATPIYIDPLFDIAIIQSDSAKDLKEAKLDCNMDFPIGLPVGAFGHPSDADYTGTKGIVSAITSDTSIFGDFIQTDAPINPGNSGGALIDLKRGLVVGMNTAGKTNAQNMNYAIPSEQLCEIITLLKSGVDPTPHRLGLKFFKDSDDKSTLRVAKADAAASSFGFLVDDIILGVHGDDRIVTTEPRLLNLLRKHEGAVTLKVLRNGKTVLLKGSFARMENTLAKTGFLFSGILVRENEDSEFQSFLFSKSRVLVDFVADGSIGEGSGIRATDIVESANGTVVTDLKSLVKVVERSKAKKQPVVLRVKRPNFEQGQIFIYIERRVNLDDLKMISVKPVAGSRRLIAESLD
jgi:S1-C subfamily serine protease